MTVTVFLMNKMEHRFDGLNGDLRILFCVPSHHILSYTHKASDCSAFAFLDLSMLNISSPHTALV